MARRLIQVPRMSRIPGRAPATPCACVARLGIRGPSRVATHPRTYTYGKCPVSPAERLAPTGAVGVRPGIQGHESLVAIAEGKHAYPSRTRPLSPPAPRILGAGAPGKVGRCQAREMKRASGAGRESARLVPGALYSIVLAIGLWADYNELCVLMRRACGSSSGVEHRLAKARAAGSNPVFRSRFRAHSSMVRAAGS